MVQLFTDLNKMLHWFWLVQTWDMSEILVSAEICFVNLNLSKISAETKISDLRKISAEIWLKLETFRESDPWNNCMIKGRNEIFTQVFMITIIIFKSFNCNLRTWSLCYIFILFRILKVEMKCIVLAILKWSNVLFSSVCFFTHNSKSA